MTSRLSRRHSRTVARRWALRLAGGRPRAAAMLEFAMIFPIFLFMCLLTVDLGYLMLMSGALQDTAFVAARKGAASGEPGTGRSGSSWDGFQEVFVSIPGADVDRVTDFQAAATSSGTAGNISGSSQCTTGTPWVQVRVVYRQRLITPGLGRLMNLAAGTLGDEWSLSQTAVARCEVIR